VPISFLKEYLVYFKYVLPVVACLVIVEHALLQRRQKPFLQGLLTSLLVVSVYLGIWNYTEPHWRQHRYFNAYEFFHYYLGAKYAPEIGYTNLYNATIIADEETGGKVKGRTIRSLDTHRIVPADRVLRDKARYKALFKEERWKAFSTDVPFFRKRVSSGLWNRMLNDKGYNATPVWTMISGILANTVSTQSPRGMAVLPCLDVLLMLCAIACVWWAFGHRVALLMALLVCTHYLTSHFTLKAAFLRVDWVMCLVMAVCMIKKERYKTAGLLTAYATMARVFPLIFAFGIGAKALLDLIKTRRINPRYFGYFAALGGTAAALFLASVIYDGGLGAWREFLGKMAVHNTDIAAWRVGFKYIFLMSYRGSAFWGTNLKTFFEQWKLVWWGIQLALLLLSFLLVRHLDDYEAMAYGYVPVFFLVAPTYYYHVMLIVPFLFFAAKMERPTRMAGIFMLFASGMVGHKLYALWDRGYALFFTMSCLLFVFVLYTMALCLLEALRTPVPGATPPQETPQPPTTGTPGPKKKKRKSTRKRH